MTYLKERLISLIVRHVAAIAVVGLVTLLLHPFFEYLGAQVIALIYLAPVILATLLLGLTPGVLAGFVSFLAFNYFFIPPYRTFSVNRPQDIITLVVFLIIAVITSQLLGQARDGVHLAKLREWEATRMYELISALAGASSDQSVSQILAQHTQDTFHCDSVEVVVQNSQTRSAIGKHAPDKLAPNLCKPMMTSRKLEGEINLWLDRSTLTQEEKRLLDTFAGQAALAIERIRLSRGENRAKVLDETDRAKSSLLSSVSHELRSPLSVIKASVSSLRSGAVEPDSEASQDLLASIEEESDALNALVGNLLDMSRIEAGALKPNLGWNSLAEIASGLVKRMRSHLQDYQVELDLPGDLPLVLTDYVLIEQVFSNLISNSVKFAPKQSTIKVAARKEIDCVHVRVTNQGPPVPDEYLDRIFDKFNRVNASDRITGTGLGLSICKGIIEAHEGKIWAENEPCCFTFHFTLPLKMNSKLPALMADEPHE